MPIFCLMLRIFNRKPVFVDDDKPDTLAQTLLGANMVQKSANDWEIKAKDGKYRIFIPVYMGL